MRRNIYLAYFLSSMKNTWFWLGIWVLYYLKFTDYAGIGLIESVLIITYTVGEIPTGAIADLLGKKKTLILALLFEFLGGLIMAFATTFYHLPLAVFVMCVGGVLYSGTLEALVYDSLKQLKKEATYGKIIANMSSISLATIALASVVGGFLYHINYRLPFISNAAGYFFGLFATFFLLEPLIGTQKFSWRNYLIQTKQGFTQLFKKTVKAQVVNLLILGGVLVVLTEMLDSILLFEFGFSGSQMGIIFAAIYLISAFSSQLSPWLKKKMGSIKAINLLGLVTAALLMLSPVAGLALGGMAVLLLENIIPVFNNLTSETINGLTESKYRATTISTFNMIKNIPYVITAYALGSLMDLITARSFAFYFGLVLALGLVTLMVKTRKLKVNE